MDNNELEFLKDLNEELYSSNSYDKFDKFNFNNKIDINRILNRLDELYALKDIKEIDKLFDYWSNEIKIINDKRTELILHNECMGFCRMQKRREESFYHVESAIRLIEELYISKTISAATIYLNIATVYKSFDIPNEAIKYYKLSEKIYKDSLEKDDRLFACLYNNMALSYVDIKNLMKVKSYIRKQLI